MMMKMNSNTIDDCQLSSTSLIKENDEEQQQFFLCKTLYRWLGDDQPLCGDDHDNDTITIKSTSNNRTLYKFEYHIIFNVNYQAPVLYFYICDQDGRSVSLEWLWNRLPNFHSKNQQKNNINIDEIYQSFGRIITQTNHPIFGHIVFMIHPCQTTTLMGQVLSCKHCCLNQHDSQSIFDDDNCQQQSSSSPTTNEDQHCTYLITWLSSLASYIGLPMSLNYEKERPGNPHKCVLSICLLK
uniref:Ubiquitin-like-conjugating enzyme ATG10 n=1 Tax=Dermatophagoides pteronyssinus TaxID=6956 RepID=A0A6P6XYP1_DERPT|nr:ubiquitin-like-conjugating enzyme ATG10 isoform X1 [Dermatophagoides pteronyssinus]